MRWTRPRSPFKEQSLNINAALDSLLYTPTANYNGSDTLTVTTNDRGNTGDANGNLIPTELADALTDTDKLTITITPVNDAPVANPDTVKALEAGGWYNDIDGYPGVINVLKNDTDVDLADKPSVREADGHPDRPGFDNDDRRGTRNRTSRPR